MLRILVRSVVMVRSFSSMVARLSEPVPLVLACRSFFADRSPPPHSAAAKVSAGTDWNFTRTSRPERPHRARGSTSPGVVFVVGRAVAHGRFLRVPLHKSLLLKHLQQIGCAAAVFRGKDCWPTHPKRQASSVPQRSAADVVQTRSRFMPRARCRSVYNSCSRKHFQSSAKNNKKVLSKYGYLGIVDISRPKHRRPDMDTPYTQALAAADSKPSTACSRSCVSRPAKPKSVSPRRPSFAFASPRQSPPSRKPLCKQ